SKYVNHAHNDFLEILFEGGVVAAFPLVLYAGLILEKVFWFPENPLQRAALLSVGFLLMHSTIDYPLRTMAVAITFAFLNGILFHRRLNELGSRDLPGVDVDMGSNSLRIPVEREAPNRRRRRTS